MNSTRTPTRDGSKTNNDSQPRRTPTLTPQCHERCQHSQWSRLPTHSVEGKDEKSQRIWEHAQCQRRCPHSCRSRLPTQDTADIPYVMITPNSLEGARPAAGCSSQDTYTVAKNIYVASLRFHNSTHAVACRQDLDWIPPNYATDNPTQMMNPMSMNGTRTPTRDGSKTNPRS